MKAGTVVQLKSGSPSMTVKGFYKNPMNGKINEEMVDVVWFDGNSKHKDTFPIELLDEEEGLDLSDI